MRYRPLGRTGLSVSVIGFGASPLGDVFGAVGSSGCEQAVQQAIDAGINFFDVSPYYGGTLAESRLGAALKGRRTEIILASKCGRNGFDQFDFAGRGIAASVERSLKRLQTDYLDLLQAHDIEFGDERQIVEETVPALRKLQQEGKARFIGITGYPLAFLKRVASQIPMDTILSYCRYNLLIDDLNLELAPFAKANGIGLINASPLHMGVLAADGAPAWHPAPREVLEAGKRVRAVLLSKGRDPEATALGFCLEHDYVSTTLVGMKSAKEVSNNVRALECRPEPAVLRSIQEVAGAGRNRVWASGRPENSDAITQ